ncbi:MAG: pro-sigmaK processing inhibitor BofA family protein [Oscillospiraceae bacterium]|nr:pro-sigmaK processing inhibitor BofA family protein [Oscillospiraceae bacterium]
MDLTQEILLAIAAVLAVLLVLRLFAAPLRLALKVLVNTAVGFLALIVVNLTAAITGVAVGVNLINAVVIGVLGLPGFVLLLLMQWMFT